MRNDNGSNNKNSVDNSKIIITIIIIIGIVPMLRWSYGERQWQQLGRTGWPTGQEEERARKCECV
jgi:hypothetical protein